MYKTSIFLVNIKGWKCMFLCKFIRILICMMDKILVKTRVRKLNFYCYPVYVFIYWLCAWDTKEFLHLFSVQNFDIYQHKQDILIKLFVIGDPYAQKNICLWLAMPVFWFPLFQYNKLRMTICIRIDIFPQLAIPAFQCPSCVNDDKDVKYLWQTFQSSQLEIALASRE